jgi:deoxyribodipyrimidine photo-lyase
MNYNIFIFRRDLRLIDNKGLDYAINNFDNIIPIFIFTPEQIKNNKYHNDNAIQFMCETLIELNKKLKKDYIRDYYTIRNDQDLRDLFQPETHNKTKLKLKETL